MQLIITDAGRAALVNAANSGTNAVSVAQVGVTATAIVPGTATAALPGEIKRIATISGDAVAADVIHLIVRDESAASYTVRSFALYLDDGTLFASYGQADPIIEKSTAAMMLLALDVTLADVSAETIQFGDTDFLNPPATTETAGVVERATDAEAMALTDALRYLTPKQVGLIFSAANVLARMLAVDGAGSGLDADLLDGQQGSWYADVPARLGYTPANRAGDTFAGPIRRDPYLYLDLPNASSADLSFDAGNVLRFDRSLNRYAFLVNSQDRLTVAANGVGITGTLETTGAITQGGNQVWHVGNDGEGSGLDADLLDGRHSSAFALISGASFAGTITAPNVSAVAGTLSAYPQTNPTSWSTPLLILGEATKNPAYSLNTGYWLNGGQWQGFINAIAASAAAPMNIQPSGGSSIVGGPMVVAGTLTRAGNQVWDAGNDGAGSGLDADLLDGQQGSWYADIPARLGYTPANRAGDTFAGPIRRDPYLYLDLPNASSADLSFDAGDVLRFDRSINRYAFLVNSQDRLTVAANGVGITGTLETTGAITQGGNQVWHVGNDGAGSGLDADLLDGWHRDQIRAWANLTGVPAAFPPNAHTHGAADIASAFGNHVYGSPGYQILPGGLILQWGSVRSTYTTEMTVAVTFPLTFPGACLCVNSTGFINGASTSRDLWPQICGEPSTSGVTIQLQSDDGNDRQLHGFDWFAIGY